MEGAPDRRTRGSNDPRALVVIPGTVNYFYNTNGRRLAEALTSLGYSARVRSPREGPAGEWDLCILSNLSEVVHSFGPGAEPAAIDWVRSLASSCKAIAAASLDSVMTPWFRRTLDLCDAAGVPTLLDLGLWDQRPYLDDGAAGRYHFVRDGLTPSEGEALEAALADRGHRPIPWAFVGHATTERAAFADYLIGRVDPSGFFYMPPLGPIAESQTSHLNPRQFRAVLRRSRCHVWCSHHGHFYMEPERFRLPLLEGCLPLKVLMDGQEPPADAPLRDLMISRAELPRVVDSGSCRWLLERAAEEYRRHPLAAGLAPAVEAMGLPATPRGPAPRVAPARACG